MTEIVDMTNAAELDAFVERHSRCHFMQTSLYGRFRTDRTWTGIICRDRNRNIRGTMALLRHTTHHFNLSFFYAPRGPIFDDGDLATFRELIEAARQLAKQCGAYMLRVDPAIEETDAAFLQCAQELGFRRKDAVDYSMSQPRMCYISDLAGLDTESLLMHYSRMKRYDVRRAMRNGVTVRMGSVEDVPVFNRMMEATAEKKGFTADFELLEKIETLGIRLLQERRRSDTPMCANVDLYSGLVYTMLGIPEELFTPLFASARISGWCANRIEEILTGKRIMRPAYRAVTIRGEYVPIEARTPQLLPEA